MDQISGSNCFKQPACIPNTDPLVLRYDVYRRIQVKFSRPCFSIPGEEGSKEMNSWGKSGLERSMHILASASSSARVRGCHQ